ncbi:L-2-hydroxyglutarate oxidase [Homoserinimonas aerilata]|uniref:L-2-hydroxyglutarate oxidase n=1 Tax=Homoserinimonas aerilata TaxID=1162970 RepID=A0A542YA99_9MICO|nr:L-2-hydroxyglutarate oxidase [Homoserinimonas aerilata]TQL45028.1 L-2-hydroxyglutarate oxidase [Homoserinimonas aerilata]
MKTLDVDFCIIGGGIVGLATAKALLDEHPDARVVVLEKEDAVARHQTGHNSGVIHSGIYYAPGSLKAKFSIEGGAATTEFCREHGIEVEFCGKLLVATNSVEVERMNALEERAGLHGLRSERLSRSELRRREPNVNGSEALFIPSTGIVDYTQVSLAIARVIEAAGASIHLGARVTSIAEDSDGVTIETPELRVRAGHLVACAGLQADRIARLAGVQTDVQIIPFRGEYFLLAPERRGFVNSLIYPIPDPELPFLGIHISPTISGEITVGPSAVLGLAREGYPKFSLNPRDVLEYALFPGLWRVAGSNVVTAVREMRNSLFKSSYLREAQKYAPALRARELLPYEAGIRAQAVARDGTLIHDFMIEQTARMTHVLNAPSPAATAAFPIGRHIARQIGVSD